MSVDPHHHYTYVVEENWKDIFTFPMHDVKCENCKAEFIAHNADLSELVFPEELQKDGRLPVGITYFFCSQECKKMWEE